MGLVGQPLESGAGQVGQLGVPAAQVGGPSGEDVTTQHGVQVGERLAGMVGLAAVLGMLVWFYVGKAQGHSIGFLYVSATGLLVTFLAGSLISLALPRQSADRLKGLTLWGRSNTSENE